MFFDFLIRNRVIRNAQKSIGRLDPAVNIALHQDLPLPSISEIKRISQRVQEVNAREETIKAFSDAQLRDQTRQFKETIEKETALQRQQLAEVYSKSQDASDATEKERLNLEKDRLKKDLQAAREKVLQKILPEAFAVAREAARRTVKMRPYDVQIAGGIVLHEGKIAEMATGEGKTLVATLPSYLNALIGEGVHIVTVNDYLARRDRQWMGPIYEFLGLSVGAIQHDMNPQERQVAYGCDITYGTNNEFGFDYLRDNMVVFEQEMVQRGHYYAVVDEVDSILIDEARTPLIISGPAEESTDKYYKANRIASQLKGRRITEKEEIEAKINGTDLYQGVDYVADEKARSISMSETGEQKAAELFGVENLHDMETIEFRHHILQALKAKEFFKCDVDYVIRDGKVIIVDEFTGRMMPGRRWSDGLHQAVESKEGIKIERENQTLATITFQNYFRMYHKLAGMTGTAYTEAAEFRQIYDLDCVVMPTNRILKRTNHSDCIYKTKREKFNAVVEEIEQMYTEGRPVLVGTISIEKSELLSAMLRQKGIAHEVLNAKYHEREAHIIAQAGRHKAVTIATNMAGRGTDILLGGNAEHLAQSLYEEKIEDEEDQEKQKQKYDEFIRQFEDQVQKEHAQVVELGGLHVLGTERHESRRIDNQLRGRSGRQGDPGSSRFFVSLEDDLMRLFGSDRMMSMMDKLGMEEGQVIEHSLVSRALEVAQKRVEQQNFEIRKQLLEYDNVMNKQREVLYGLRRSVLQGAGLKEKMIESIEELSYLLSDRFLTTETQKDGWDPQGLSAYLKRRFECELQVSAEVLERMSNEEIRQLVFEELVQRYQQKEKDIAPDRMRHLEKMLLLQTIDAKWKDHLYAMDRLREGIGLRAMGQRDPLVEYQREGFDMFQMMFSSIHSEVAEMIFKIQPIEGKEQAHSVFRSLPQKLIHQDFSSLNDKKTQGPQAASILGSSAASRGQAKSQPVHRDQQKVGRNDSCPCGSGKKYKKCCGR